MAKRKNDWQDTDKVLGMFGDKAGPARRAYRAFVEKGITQGKRSDLTGGDLVRSAGGWAAVNFTSGCQQISNSRREAGKG